MVFVLKKLILVKVVSIGHFTAFYVVFILLEYIPIEPPHYTYVIVLFLYFRKSWEGPQYFNSTFLSAHVG